MNLTEKLGALRFAVPALLILAALPLSGCVLGNTAEVNIVRSTTIGQELLDLEEARAKGIINESEFRDLKDKIKQMADAPELDFDGDAD
jgi:hypothetical protein